MEVKSGKNLVRRSAPAFSRLSAARSLPLSENLLNFYRMDKTRPIAAVSHSQKGSDGPAEGSRSERLRPRTPCSSPDLK